MIPLLIYFSYYLVPIIFILGCYFYFSYQKLKEVEVKKLQFLQAEISSEKKVAHQLKNVPKEVEKLNNTTKIKLLKIKIDIFNTNFTLSELF